MKFYLSLAFMILVCLRFPMIGNANLPIPEINTTILNQNPDRAIVTDLSDDPLRDGTAIIVGDGNPNSNNNLGNIIGSDPSQRLGSFANAQNSTINIINIIVNYSMGILALIAVIYLIYNGLLILSSSQEEDAYKKGISGVKNAIIAITGIGLSWFIVSLIFYIIDLIIS